MRSVGPARQKLLPVAILAGGMGSRLRPYTDEIPKALIEVQGEPFIGYQLRLLSSQGVRKVVICAGYLGRLIQEYVGAGDEFGLAVSFSFDGPRLLGTGGAIKKALPLLGAAFFVVYGDAYLRCDYQAVQWAFQKSGKKGLMTVYHNQNQHDKSNVELRDGVIRSYDKVFPSPAMQHIDYGLSVFRASAFDGLSPDASVDLADIYQELLRSGHLAAFEVQNRFYEIGSPQGLQEFREVASSFSRKSDK